MADDDILLFQMTDLDLEDSPDSANGHSNSGSDADDEEHAKKKPIMPLRERRIKRAYAIAEQKPILKPLVCKSNSPSNTQWWKAVRKVRKETEIFKLSKIKT